jgi:hypothetical protein
VSNDSVTQRWQRIDPEPCRHRPSRILIPTISLRLVHLSSRKSRDEYLVFNLSKHDSPTLPLITIMPTLMNRPWRAF